MGQGIQPQSVQQTAPGNAFADVVKVLYEPTAVFERVRARPSFLAPFLAIVAVQCVLFFVNLPFLRVAVQAQIAASAQSRPAPSTAVLAGFGLFGLVVVLSILLVLTALLVWVLASVLGGGDAKFSTLLSVVTYSAVPSGIVLAIVGAIVLHLQGVGQITSTQDLQPALGLDLLSPASRGFVGAMLRGINPFSIWGIILTATGIATTQRMSKGNSYTIAIVAFLLLLAVGSGLASLSPR